MGEKREKLRNIVQYFAIKNAKRREPTNTGWELGLKGTGSGRFKPLCSPPLLSGLKAENASNVGKSACYTSHLQQLSKPYYCLLRLM